MTHDVLIQGQSIRTSCQKVGDIWKLNQSRKMGQFIDQVIICKTFIVHVPWETQRLPRVFGLASLKRKHYYARERSIFFSIKTRGQQFTTPWIDYVLSQTRKQRKKGLRCSMAIKFLLD